MGTTQTHWFPVIASPNIVTIVEECDCVCSPKGPCCCLSSRKKLKGKNGLKTIKTDSNTGTEPIFSDVTMYFEEFDGVDDILAVSHLSENTLPKKRNPLLRAKTLPAIISPSLTILQAQLDPAARNLRQKAGANEQLKVSPTKPKSKRSPASAGKKANQTLTEKWQLLVDDELSSSKSSGNSPRNSFSSTGSGASHTSGNKDSKYEQGSSGSHTRAGLAKLARLLNPREKSVSGDKPTRHSSDNSLASDPTSMRKANSIDSLLETSITSYKSDMVVMTGCVGSSPTATNGKALPNSPSVPAKLDSQRRNTNGHSTPSPNILTDGRDSVERLADSGPLTKAERKKLEKVNKFNIDLQALFAAVEHEQLDRARSILESRDVDINSVNGDGFTPLDLAVMTTNVAMVKLLQAHGATESPKFPGRDSRSTHLQGLFKEAGRCVEDLGTCVLSAATNGSLSAALLKEKERQLSLWQRRHHLLKKMKAGLDRIRPPDPPSSVQLEVVGTRSLRVKFGEPSTAHDQESIVTKYKVEWSCYEDFSLLSGAVEISDVQKLEVTVPDLTQGSAYFVRVAAGNVKGFSAWQSASPLSATPSCWRDVEGKKCRSSGHIGKLDDLFYQVTNARSPHSKEIKDLSDTPQQQRKQVRKSIKHLFTSAPKFQKNMKRGVFLACLLYAEDKVAVTADDTLPIIEVDENYPSPLHTDFYWLMKIACTWEDVKALRQDMEKSHSSSNVHFRIKLLQAVEHMQSALGLQDLGQLYQRPLKDSEGTTVLCTIKRVADPKSMVALSVRWLPLYKLLKKHNNNNNGDGLHEPSANDLLLESVSDMMTYHRVSSTALPRGLYVGYVKLKSSVDVIRVLVPKHMPNVLPFYKVRENPHVSCEEWQWFRNMATSGQPEDPTEIQMKFKKAISIAAKNLLTDLNINKSEVDAHRFYDAEVIELSKDVSFLLVLPPVDSVCSVPGQCEEITGRLECISLPVQIFEMIHMMTYQPKFISRYSRLSSILEMDTIVANHAHREAFSTSEMMQTKTRLNLLQDLQGQIDNTWRAVRWIMDVLTFARDKQVSGGIPLKNIWMDKMTPDSPSPPPSNIMDHSYSKPEKNGVLERNFTLTTPTHETWFHEIRRCSSTSRLHVSGTDQITDDENKDLLLVDPHPKAHSAERLGTENNNKDLVDADKKRDSVRSSFTGSLSSLDIMLDDDKLSVYSKDSACSVGAGEDSFLVASRKTNSLDWPLAPSPNEETGSGVIRVYAAYETGLPSGTSVKLHITPLTTAREVVDLVVKQLNMAVVLKGRGGPIYASSHLSSFCLVSMVGSKERCLGDDFQPMKLQGPWVKGKLYVRRKSCPPFPISVD